MMLNYHTTIDDFLGDSESRYFGSGYFNTARTLRNFEHQNTEEGIKFSCVGSLCLLGLWSQKGDVAQIPHLSSIDVIELAIECTKRIFDQLSDCPIFSLDAIDRICVIAGNEPVEQVLESISIKGLMKQTPEGTCQLHVRISNMDVEVTFSLGRMSRNVLAVSEYPVSIENVFLNRENSTASAIVTPHSAIKDKSWSLATCFASMAQLGQTLLYKLDSMDRKTSSTLWMRRISINIFSGIPEFFAPQPIHVKLNNARVLRMNRENWRSADICSWFCNTNIVCRVAHKIGNTEILS
jgi:hypothetical protein